MITLSEIKAGGYCHHPRGTSGRMSLRSLCRDCSPQNFCHHIGWKGYTRCAHICGVCHREKAQRAHK